MRHYKTCFFIVFFVFGLFNSSFVYSQNMEIRGKIISESDDSPVPFATISLARLKTGTSANENGYFILELKKIKETDVLLISCVGYNSKTISLSELKDNSINIIKITQGLTMLEEQVVTADALDARAIVSKAAKNRKKIMSGKPYLISAIYNEQLYIEEELSGAMQGFGMAYIDGYNDRNYAIQNKPRDQIQWKQIRRSEYNNQLEEYTSYVGAYKLLKAKDNYFYNGPVSTPRIANYEYFLDSLSIYNDATVFLIRFESKKNKGETGRLVIDEETYSILNIEVNNSNEDKKYDFFNKKIKSVRSKFTLSMSKIGKIYYINAISFDLESIKKDTEESKIREHFDLYAGQYNSGSGVIKTNQAQKSVLFYEMVNPQISFMDSFWEEKTTIEFPVQMKPEYPKQFEANNGRRIAPIPDGFSNYQDLYNDRQVFDIYFADF